MGAMLKAVGILFLLVFPVKPDTDVENEEVFDYNKEHYTSSVLGLVKLFELEREFMENFTLYADALQKKANNLNIYLDSLKRPSYATHKEREKFVSNPLNAFGLIRRLNQDWPKLQNYSKQPVGVSYQKAMEEILTRAPNSHDMNETLKAMHRIETTYDLQAKDIANGLLQSKQFNYKLSSRDCLALAQHKFEFGDYNRSLMWFTEALEHKTDSYDDNENNSFEAFSRAVIKRTVSLSNLSVISETLHQLLTNYNQENEIVEFISSKLRQWDTENSNATDGTGTPPPTAHDMGCRGLFPKRTNLVCRYNSTTTPFLKLAPLKLEELSLDPYIVLYHNVISDKEIEDIKGEIIGKMGNGWANKDEIVSLVYWTRHESAIRKRINQRIADMTGFDLEEFPALQLANFGVGGYFRPHYDYFTERILEVDPNNPLGERIGSLIFYAGDVSQGGQTVFPDVQVAVEPKKGNALFWFNTFDDASQDPRSLHSVCPVIVGSRWTVTKWLHYVPQLFVKPCSPKVLKRSS